MPALSRRLHSNIGDQRGRRTELKRIADRRDEAHYGIQHSLRGTIKNVAVRFLSAVLLPDAKLDVVAFRTAEAVAENGI